MKYLRLYEFNDEFKKDYWGENYLEHWVSLTKNKKEYSPKIDGFTIENGDYFVLGFNEDAYVKESGTTEDYNGDYFFDRYDEEHSRSVYTNGSKELFLNIPLGVLIVSDTTDVNSPEFQRSVVFISTPDSSQEGIEQEATVIKISGLVRSEHIEEIKRVNYDKTQYEKDLAKPLTITALENGTLSFVVSQPPIVG